MVTNDSKRFEPGTFNTPEYAGKIKQDLNLFDNSFFNISGSQAERLDPQIRLLLETSFEAVIDSGLDTDTLNGTQTGVYVGGSASDAHRFWCNKEESMSGYEHTGGVSNMYANRISFFYNLHGPSYTVDTACSSSLSALVVACRDLESGRVNSAFVGGTALVLDPRFTVGFDRFHMLAPEGFCKTFDESANGFTRSEAVVVLFLTTDENLIKFIPHAEILAAESNSCGYHPKGITFPDHKQQVELYRSIFYKVTDLSPADIAYIETHGTGTIVGDSEELQGIQTVFNSADLKRKAPLIVGGIKSNVGHTETAAGLSGLAKVLLMFENRTVYPQLHLKEPIALTDSLHIPTEVEEWNPNYSIVNSYGFGGANACVLLAPPSRFQSACLPMLKRVESQSFNLQRALNLTSVESQYLEPWNFISSRTSSGLSDLVSYIKQSKEFIPIPCILNKHQAAYRGVWCNNSNYQLGKIGIRAENPKIILAFSGSGSQWKGMEEGVWLSSQCIVENQALQAHAKCFTGDNQSVLESTEQLVFIQIALLQFLKYWGIPFDYVCGHSAGEIASGYATGIYDDWAAFEIANARAKSAIACSGMGDMLAVMASSKEVETIIQEYPSIIIACYNTNSSVTLAGSVADLTKVKEIIQEKGIKSIMLNTGVPFHHAALLGHSKLDLENDLMKISSAQSPFPASWLSSILDYEPSMYSHSYHVESVFKPVDFNKTLQKIPPNSIVIEVGPHSVLRNYIQKEVSNVIYIPLMKKGVPASDSLKDALYQLWINGIKIPLIDSHIASIPRAPLPVRELLTSWDRHEFKVPLWEDIEKSQNSSNQNNSGYSFKYDLKGRYKFLNDHYLDGRSIFPAVGYIDLLCHLHQTQYPMAKCLIIEDLKVIQAVYLLDDASEIEFFIKQTTSTNVPSFEFICGGDVTATASIRLLKDDNDTVFTEEYGETIIPEVPETHAIDGEAFYRIVNNMGYDYRDSFLGVKHLHLSTEEHYQGIPVVCGCVVQASERIPLLDSILQVSLIGSSNDLRLIAGIGLVEINLQAPWTNLNELTYAKVYAARGSTRCAEISGLCTIQEVKPASTQRKDRKNGLSQLTRQIYLPFGKSERTSYRDLLRSTLIYGNEQFNNRFPSSSSESQPSHIIKIGKIVNDFIQSKFPKHKFSIEDVKDENNNFFYRTFKELYEVPTWELDSIFTVLASCPVFPHIYSGRVFIENDDAIAMVDVIRSNGTLVNFQWFEIGTGTGSFLKSLFRHSFVYADDKIITSDVDPVSRFVYDPTCQNFPIEYEYWNLDEFKFSEAMSNADCIAAQNSLHVAKNLEKTLQHIYTTMKDGAFFLIHEVTCPFGLPTFGLEPSTWNSEDERAFGLWTSVDHWLDLFKKVGFCIIAYSTDSDEMLTIFLLRKSCQNYLNQKIQIRASPTIHTKDPREEMGGINNDELVVLVDKHDNAKNGMKTSGVHGFVRSLRREMKNVYSLEIKDAQTELEIEKYVECIHKFQIDTNCLHNGKLCTFAHLPLSIDLPSVENDNKQIFKVVIDKIGDLNTLHAEIVPIHRLTKSYIDIKYTSVNFRDIGFALGRLRKDGYHYYRGNPRIKGTPIGFEFSGITNDNRRVMGVALTYNSNRIDADEALLLPVPDSMSLEQAATIPLVYLTVLYAFHMRAKVREGQSILIHSAAGAVGQAAIHVAHLLKMKIFATCSSKKVEHLLELFPFLDRSQIFNSRTTEFEKKILTTTKFEGVDNVLNSLSDDKFQASWRCIKAGGNFMEIGKVDFMNNVPLPTNPFQNNVSFHGIDLDAAIRDKVIVEELSDLMIKGLESGVVKPLEYTVFPISEINAAYAFLASGKHTGKIILDMNTREPSWKISSRFITSGTHVIIGGLGGIGMELSNWLAERGAQKIILISKTGIRTGEQTINIQKLRLLVDVEIIKANCIDPEECDRVLSKVSPITGIWHLAMLRKDQYYDEMTADQWMDCVKVKANIALNVHEWTAKSNKDCIFICFSSVCSKMGNHAQSNYAFGNNYMETLCEYRKSIGLPALAIQVGVISNFGFVSRVLAKSKNNLSVLNYASMKLEEFLAITEKLLLHSQNHDNCPAVVSIFSLPEKENEVEEEIEHTSVIGVVAEVLHLDLLSYPPTTSLTQLGIDSLQSVELQSKLSRLLGRMFPLQKLNQLTIEGLHELEQDLQKNPKKKTTVSSHSKPGEQSENSKDENVMDEVEEEDYLSSKGSFRPTVVSAVPNSFGNNPNEETTDDKQILNFISDATFFDLLRNVDMEIDDNIIMQLYAYARQSIKGDNSTPLSDNPEEAAKWQAWNNLQGLSQSEAKNFYCKSVAELFQKCNKLEYINGKCREYYTSSNRLKSSNLTTGDFKKLFQSNIVEPSSVEEIKSENKQEYLHPTVYLCSLGIYVPPVLSVEMYLKSMKEIILTKYPGDKGNKIFERFRKITDKTKVFYRGSMSPFLHKYNLAYYRYMIDQWKVEDIMTPFKMEAPPHIRSNWYRKWAPKMAARSIRKATVNFTSEDWNTVTHIITCSSSGWMEPGIAAKMIDEFKLNKNKVRKVDLFMNGCFTSSTAMRIARDTIRSGESETVICVGVELTSNSLGCSVFDADLDMVIAGALFADGSGCCILTSNRELAVRQQNYASSPYCLDISGMSVVPDSKDLLQLHPFAIKNPISYPPQSTTQAKQKQNSNSNASPALPSGSLKSYGLDESEVLNGAHTPTYIMTLNAQVPGVIRDYFDTGFGSTLLDNFILSDRKNNDPNTLPSLAIHPGGPAILDALDDLMKSHQFHSQILVPSYRSLHKYGNLGSTAMYFVLFETFKALRQSHSNSPEQEKVTQVVNKVDDLDSNIYEWDEGEITEKFNDKKVCYFAFGPGVTVEYGIFRKCDSLTFKDDHIANLNNL